MGVTDDTENQTEVRLVEESCCWGLAHDAAYACVESFLNSALHGADALQKATHGWLGLCEEAGHPETVYDPEEGIIFDHDSQQARFANSPERARHGDVQMRWQKNGASEGALGKRPASPQAVCCPSQDA